MKTWIFIFAIGCLTLEQKAAAIPSEITYQGTLKQKGLPANGVYSLLFRVTNQDGNQVYWSSTNQPTTVTNGLFAVHLSPSGVEWERISPFLEVSIDGQILLPREPVTANVYALVSASVQDGSITPAKLNAAAFQSAGVGVVPQGAILMFAADCPAGWTRFGALDGRFPLGSTSYGSTGGSSSHSHDGTTGFETPNGCAAGDYSCGAHDFAAYHHQHSFGTDARSHLPPYLGVVFCQKQ